MLHEDAEVAAIANDIDAVCAGRSTAAVYAAIAVVIGRTAATARKPDLDSLLGLITRAARGHFQAARPMP